MTFLHITNIAPSPPSPPPSSSRIYIQHKRRREKKTENIKMKSNKKATNENRQKITMAKDEFCNRHFFPNSGNIEIIFNIFFLQSLKFILDLIKKKNGAFQIEPSLANTRISQIWAVAPPFIYCPFKILVDLMGMKTVPIKFSQFHHILSPHHSLPISHSVLCKQPPASICTVFAWFLYIFFLCHDSCSYSIYLLYQCFVFAAFSCWKIIATAAVALYLIK